MARARFAQVGMVGLVAAALLSGALGMLAPASAGDGGALGVTSGKAISGVAVATEKLPARALPKRNLQDKLLRKPPRLFLKGNVNPGYARKNIIILRAKCRTCTPTKGSGLNRTYKKVGKVRTNRYGKFKFQLSAPRTGVFFFKAYAKKSGAYGKSWSNYIYTTYRL